MKNSEQTDTERLEAIKAECKTYHFVKIDPVEILWLLSQLEASQQRVAQLLAKYNGEVDEFNAGHEAHEAGEPESAEPAAPYDLWRTGYAGAAYDPLKKQVAELRAALYIQETEELARLAVAKQFTDELQAENARLRGERPAIAIDTDRVDHVSINGAYLYGGEGEQP